MGLDQPAGPGRLGRNYEVLGRLSKRAWLLSILAGLVLCSLLFLAVPVVRPEAPFGRAVLDRKGQLLAARIAADEQWRLAPVRSLPQKYQIALLAFEDRRFFTHPGVDIFGIARAIGSNLRQRRVVSGASTLTMQLVRLARKNPRRTLTEKGLEMLLALRLDAALSKNELLAEYASFAPFGGNIVGLRAASWRYFGRASNELTWAEAAMLAVLPNRPGAIHLEAERPRLKHKRDRLLRYLFEQGHLDSTSWMAAVREPLPQGLRPIPRLARHLLDRPEAHASVWTTSIDAQLQGYAEHLTQDHLRTIAADQIHNTAALIASHRTGEILAYVANQTLRQQAAHSPDVDILRSLRSPGSLLKPFLYAARLDAGEMLPNQLVPDLPTRFGNFTPKNFDKGYRGAVRAPAALARSLNVPAVVQLRDYGVERFVRKLRRLRLTTFERAASHYGLSIILGGGEARATELASLYGHLAWRARGETAPWGGLHLSSKEIDSRIVSSDGHTSGARPSDRSTRAEISPGAAYLTYRALLEVSRPGVDALWRRFAGSQEIAWKTGTSFGFRDGWAIGVNGAYVVAVWVGNADGEGRAGLTGYRAAAPLLFRLFDRVRAPWDTAPTGLRTIQVCSHSGLLPGPHCAHRTSVEIPAPAEPDRTCPYCQTITCDSSCEHRIHADCAKLNELQPSHAFVLPPAMSWFYRQHDAAYSDPPPWRDDCRPGTTTRQSAMACLSPKEGGSIYVPLELDEKRGRAVFEATHTRSDAVIFWHLDRVYLGQTSGFHRFEVAPDPGEHRLTLIDDQGVRLVRRFTVLDPHGSRHRVGGER